jgi:hypothetical protein
LDSAGGGALVDFTSASGAHAARHIAGPDELAPTVQALVTTLDTSLLAPSPPSPLEPVKSGADVGPSRVSPPAAPEPLGLIFGTGLGARAGVAGTTVASPVLNLYATFELRRWELGLVGSWEWSYRRTVTTEDDGPLAWNESALAAGIVVGRREHLGVWDLTYGATLSGAFVRGQISEDDDSNSARRFDARIGSYVGTAVPRSAPVRFRAYLTADFSPTQSGLNTTNLASLPAWMGMGFVGVEIGAR